MKKKKFVIVFISIIILVLLLSLISTIRINKFKISSPVCNFIFGMNASEFCQSQGKTPL